MNSEARQRTAEVLEHSPRDYSGRVPPQAVDVEQYVLGAILIDPEAISVAASLLKPDAFYLPKHARIFRAMCTLFTEGNPVDEILVAEQLKAERILDMVGGLPYLADLSERVATAANVEHHSRILTQKAMARALIQTMSRRITEAYAPETDPFELLDNAESDLFSISGDLLRQSVKHVREIGEETMQQIQERGGRTDGLSGVTSGFLDLDKITGGWQDTDLIIIAGRPAMGKTAFALACARHAALASQNAVNCVIFSLEMERKQLMQRLLSSEAEVDLQKMRRGDLDREECRRVEEVRQILAGGGMWIDDSPALNILELRGKCRRLKSEHDIGLVLVDYLQLLQGKRNVDNREQEIGSISRSLKALAKELHIPVIALSQLNRNPEDRGDKRPLLSDLRESGSIEQDADMVAFIYRAEVYGVKADKSGASTEGVAEVIVGKHRNGPIGTVKLNFDKTYARFRNHSSHSPPLEHAPRDGVDWRTVPTEPGNPF